MPPSKERKFCAHPHSLCTRPRIEGYLYCESHILLDENAPFCKCAYINSDNSKQCHKAVPKKSNHERFCSSHNDKKSVNDGIEASLKEKFKASTLQKRHHSDQRNPAHKKKNLVKKFPSYVDSFAELKINPSPNDKNSDEKTCMNETRQRYSDSSESEMDFTDDDPLSQAGVYTHEEVLRIYQGKLIKLKRLYLQEMKHLEYILKERRRDYVQSVKKEKKMLGSISNTMLRTTRKETEQYEMLRAMRRYRRTFGQDAITREKSLRKRLEKAKLPVPSHLMPSNLEICTFVGKGNKCEKRALPLTKYCFDHILSDPKQVLFKKCPGGYGNCDKVIIPYSDSVRCILHSSIETGKVQKPPENGPHPVAGPSGLQNNVGSEMLNIFQPTASSSPRIRFAPVTFSHPNKFNELDDSSSDTNGPLDGKSYTKSKESIINPQNDIEQPKSCPVTENAWDENLSPVAGPSGLQKCHLNKEMLDGLHPMAGFYPNECSDMDDESSDTSNSSD